MDYRRKRLSLGALDQQHEALSMPALSLEMFSSYYWPVRTASISLEGASFYVARLFPVQIRISVARRLVSASASQVSEMQDSADSHFPKGIDPFLTAKDL